MRLREARVAWQNGRYDDASRMLADDSLREFLPAQQLARDVAGKIIERARDRFALGDTSAGWNDLAVADRLGGQIDAVNKIRHEYADAVLCDARKYLAAGDPESALSRLQKLQKRGLADNHIRACEQIGELMRESRQLAARGHFSEASAAARRGEGIAKLESAEAGIMDEIAAHLNGESHRFETSSADCHRLQGEMHAAIAAGNWGAVLSTADALLSLAPQHTAAMQARRQAWKAVGMDVTRMYAGRTPRGPVPLAVNKAAIRGERPSTHSSSRSSEDDTVAGNESPQRALLWVDAVGGFLVCLDNAVAIGQPSVGEPIALPILADLSRRHAVIRRDAGAYVIEPLQRTSVDGREITVPTVLTNNQLIQLGDNVRIRFHKPHALSATARLTIESHHKTQPTADAVLLMADSCVLGPNSHCHVRCRGWKRDVVIYRQNDQLFCRADEPLSVDGVVADRNSEIQVGARVEGEEFSFAWEALV